MPFEGAFRSTNYLQVFITVVLNKSEHTFFAQAAHCSTSTNCNVHRNTTCVSWYRSGIHNHIRCSFDVTNEVEVIEQCGNIVRSCSRSTDSLLHRSSCFSV